MKIKNKYFGIEISKDDSIWIENISKNLKSINDDLNFEKYNKIFDSTLIHQVFRNSSNENNFYENDFEIISNLKNDILNIKNAEPIFISNDFYKIFEINEQIEKRYNEVFDLILNYKSEYSSPDIETAYSIIATEKDDFKTKSMEFEEKITDSKTNKIVKNIFSKFSNFELEIKKNNEKNILIKYLFLIIPIFVSVLSIVIISILIFI